MVRRLLVASGEKNGGIVASSDDSAVILRDNKPEYRPIGEESGNSHCLETVLYDEDYSNTSNTHTSKNSNNNHHHHHPSHALLLPPLWSIWCMGLLNNTSYVLCLASAKSISEGGTALVYLCNVVPGLSLKASAPYWFDRVSYPTRLCIAASLMAIAFGMVALFSSSSSISSNSSSGGSVTTDSSSNSSSSSTPHLSSRTIGQLCGVALVSLQCSLGEASMLALAGKCDATLAAQAKETTTVANGEEDVNIGALATSSTQSSKESSSSPFRQTCVYLTAFSSGTGLSGPVGYFWKVCLNNWLGWSLRSTILLATLLALAYWKVYATLVAPHMPTSSFPEEHTASTFRDEETRSVEEEDEEGRLRHKDSPVETGETEPLHMKEQPDDLELVSRKKNVGSSSSSSSLKASASLSSSSSSPDCSNVPLTLRRHRSGDPLLSHVHENVDQDTTGVHAESLHGPIPPIASLSVVQRFWLVVGLYKYTIPLFFVYFAEYAIQSGTWTAMALGDQVHDVTARNRFYEFSNWLYQAGVFLSRSSGTLCLVSLPVLWLMPALQVGNLIIFSMIAAQSSIFSQPFYHSAGYLYVMALYTGLLGGGVYVHGYKRIVTDIPHPPSYTEFALSSTSVAESLGVVMADVTGLLLQGCLYQINNIPGAFVSQCPVR